MTSVEPSTGRVLQRTRHTDETVDAADAGGIGLVESAVSAGSLTDQFDGLGRGPDDQWLSRMVHFVSTIEAVATRHGGKVIGCLPAGVLIQHPARRAADALNTAIDSLEQLSGELDCSFGIATGAVRRAGGTVVGTPLATASRLCAAATAGAILVDHTTVSYANLSLVRSVAGIQHGRRPTDYISGSHFLPVGTGVATAYSEVRWDERTHGLDPQVLTDAALHDLGRQGPALVGSVRSWDRGKQRGFVVAASGEFFYIDDRFVVHDAPEPGDTVVFVPIAPVVRGKNRVAAAATVVPRPCHGTVVESGNGRVFVVRDPQGNRLLLPFRGGSLGPATAFVSLDNETLVPTAGPVT